MELERTPLQPEIYASVNSVAVSRVTPVLPYCNSHQNLALSLGPFAANGHFISVLTCLNRAPITLFLELKNPTLV